MVNDKDNTVFGHFVSKQKSRLSYAMQISKCSAEMPRADRGMKQ